MMNKAAHNHATKYPPFTVYRSPFTVHRLQFTAYYTISML